MLRDNRFNDGYEEERRPIPSWVFMILGVLVMLYTGYNMLKKHVEKDFEKFTVVKEGMSNLTTSDAVRFTLKWKVKYEIDDKELYDEYGKEFEKDLINRINHDIRAYYHYNNIFDSTLIDNLIKDSKVVRNIPQKIKLDTTKYYRYIPDSKLISKRLVLQKFRLIDPVYDYNKGLYIKPINLIVLPHNQPIAFSKNIINRIQREVLEKQEIIRAEQDVKRAKENLEKVKAKKERELILQDAISQADKMKKEAEDYVKRANAARAKHDAELIKQTRKHILDSINNN